MRWGKRQKHRTEQAKRYADHVAWTCKYLLGNDTDDRNRQAHVLSALANLDQARLWLEAVKADLPSREGR